MRRQGTVQGMALITPVLNPTPKCNGETYGRLPRCQAGYYQYRSLYESTKLYLARSPVSSKRNQVNFKVLWDEFDYKEQPSNDPRAEYLEIM